MLASPLIKYGLIILAVIGVIAGGIYLLHAYGDARYNEGMLAQKATDEQSVIKQITDNQKKLDSIYDYSVQAAQSAAAASDAVGTGLAAINSKFKGKTLAVIQQGKCIPSNDFVGQWNSLSTYQQQGATK